MLCSNSIAANTSKTWEALKSKHPHSPPPTIPMDPLSQSSLNILPADFNIFSIIHSFSKDTACGPSGFIIQHILDALEATLSTSLVKVLLSDCNTYSLIAINKFKTPNCDVRPIAIGEVLRQLTSRCLCTTVKSKATDYFSPHQLGIACTGEAETMIHSLRACVDRHWYDDDFVVLKVDLRNAFNNVSRQVALDQCHSHFPEVLLWVSWCNSHPTNLWHPILSHYSSFHH